MSSVIISEPLLQWMIKYSAMIPRHEDTSKLRIGDVIEAKSDKVKPDGKLDVSLRDKGILNG